MERIGAERLGGLSTGTRPNAGTRNFGFVAANQTIVLP